MRIRLRHLAAATVTVATLAACGPTNNSSTEASQSATASTKEAKPAEGTSSPSSSASSAPSDTAALCAAFANIDIEWILPGAQTTWGCTANERLESMAEQVWSDGSTRIAVVVTGNSGNFSYDKLAKVNPSNCQIAVLGHNRDCMDQLGTTGTIWINMGDSYVMIMQSRDSREDISPLKADASRADKLHRFAVNKVLPTIYSQ